MKKLVGVGFRETGRATYMDPQGESYDVGEKIVVEMEEGEELAMITVPPVEIADEKVPSKLYSIKRRVTEADMERVRKNKEEEYSAYKYAQEKIAERNLEMKLTKAEYTFSRSRLIFYFTADGRVDFRELVKDLAGNFHTRIELRQIGVRDETRKLGGVGMCGRVFCCKTFLTEFDPVSIKMAKEQRLSLNPAKISGVCGRLMCCLKNEEDTYEYLNKTLPPKGEAVKVGGRQGSVYSVNILKQLVTVLFEEEDEKETIEYPLAEIKRINQKKKGNHKKEGKDC